MDNTQNQRQILANQPNNFDTLPDEIVLEIAKKMPNLELDSLALVCPRFNCIIEDKSLWKKVVFRCRELQPDYVEKWITREVKDLTLYILTIPSPLLRPAFEATRPSWCLKEVCLDQVQASSNDLVQMFTICKQLTKVELTDVGVNNEVLVALSENKNLEILRLRWLRGMERVGLETILGNVTMLQEFHIERCCDTSTLNRFLIPKSICEILPSSLLRLTLDYCYDSLTDRHMANLVKNCPQLQTLNLCHGHALSARSTEALRTLKHLRILNMPMSSGIPFQAFLPMTQMESLVELDIHNAERNIEEYREIEEQFGVDMIEDRGPWRVGTFTNSLGTVRLTY